LRERREDRLCLLYSSRTAVDHQKVGDEDRNGREGLDKEEKSRSHRFDTLSSKKVMLIMRSSKGKRLPHRNRRQRDPQKRENSGRERRSSRMERLDQLQRTAVLQVGRGEMGEKRVDGGGKN